MGRLDHLVSPPLVLSERVVSITRPQPPPISVSLPVRAVIDVGWPRCQVTRLEPPRPLVKPDAIRLPAPPQGPRRQPLAAVTRYLLAHPEMTR